MKLCVDGSVVASALITVAGFVGLTHEECQIEKKTGKCTLEESAGKSHTDVSAILAALCGKRQCLLGGAAGSPGAVEVEKWVKRFESAAADVNKGEAAKLNTHLAQRVFLVGAHLTVADLVWSCVMHDAVKAMSKDDRFASHHMSRWFDLIQHRVSEEGRFLPVLAIDVNLPKGFKAAAAAGGDKKGGDKQQQKKQKKEKKKKEKKPKKAETPDIVRLDLRVGKVVEAKKHPEADRLYIEQVDIGAGAPIQVVSGLAEHMPVEALQGRLVCVVVNVKAGDLVGVKSSGRIFAATGEGCFDLVNPPAGAKVGERITFAGVQGEPDAVVAPKKLHKVLKLLKTDENGTPLYDTLAFTTSAGVCHTAVKKGTVA